MNTIYLVGQISPKCEITYQWRRDVKEYFINQPDKVFIDPCSNPFNKEFLEKKEYAVTELGRNFGIDVLPPKDLTFVNRSDIGLANLNQYDPDKPLLGSFFELAWYYMNPQKTVIAFADEYETDYQCQHPFVQQAVNCWCRTWEEACFVIEKYFSLGD